MTKVVASTEGVMFTFQHIFHVILYVGLILDNGEHFHVYMFSRVFSLLTVPYYVSPAKASHTFYFRNSHARCYNHHNSC